MVLPPRLTPSFWHDFAHYKATWYTATPTMLQIILSFPNPDPVPPIRFIRSCSSPLALTVFQALENRFHAPVLQAYAMTEATHHISTNPLPPASRSASSVGILPASGEIEVRILSTHGKSAESRKGQEGRNSKLGEEKQEEEEEVEEGEICIRGPSVMG